MRDFDDKDLVIFAATIIAIFSMFCIGEPENVVLNIVTGLMGIAVGKATKA